MQLNYSVSMMSTVHDCLFPVEELIIIASGLFFRYFPYIYNLSGVSATKAKLGSWFDYDLNPRSQIFKRGHAKVQDIDSLFKLMR